jgi:activator of HSP90 ATPase
MAESFEISTVFAVSAERLYRAWLSGDVHSAMTGGAAQIDPTVGGLFSAWDGYITGTTLELDPNRRIVQSWRTLEFPTDAPDSRLEVALEESADGTRLILKHSQIPAGQGSGYESGWVENYFDPMQEYFAS